MATYLPGHRYPNGSKTKPAPTPKTPTTKPKKKAK